MHYFIFVLVSIPLAGWLRRTETRKAFLKLVSEEVSRKTAIFKIEKVESTVEMGIGKLKANGLLESTFFPLGIISLRVTLAEIVLGLARYF